MVTSTGNRFLPAPTNSITSSGTGMPVAVRPDCSTMERNFIGPVRSLRG